MPKNKNDIDWIFIVVAVLLTVSLEGGVFVLRASGETPQSGASVPDSKLPCLKEADAAMNKKGNPLWLSSDVLERRLVDRTQVPNICCRRGRANGFVKIELLIGADGSVQCSRAVGGNPLAYSQVLESVAKWRFKPFQQNGTRKAVLGRLSVRYQFKN